MEGADLKEALFVFCKQNFVSIVLFLCGLILLGYGIYILFPKDTHQVTIQKTSANEERTPRVLTKKIVVDIEGAVKKPGVYSLDDQSRLEQAIDRAGGFADKADKEQIAKKINLASILTDGQKVYIPFAGETDVLSASSDSTTLGGLININTASADTLDTLSGVGPVTAQKIISNRPYQSIQDMVTKKAVSQRVFDQIKDKITTY